MKILLSWIILATIRSSKVNSNLKTDLSSAKDVIKEAVTFVNLNILKVEFMAIILQNDRLLYLLSLSNLTELGCKFCN